MGLDGVARAHTREAPTNSPQPWLDLPYATLGVQKGAGVSRAASGETTTITCWLLPPPLHCWTRAPPVAVSEGERWQAGRAGAAARCRVGKERESAARPAGGVQAESSHSSGACSHLLSATRERLGRPFARCQASPSSTTVATERGWGGQRLPHA